MRVAIVGPCGNVGSVSKITSKLAEYLALHGLEVHVLTHFGSGTSFDYMIHEVVSGNPIYFFKDLKRLVFSLNKIRPDLIHLPTTVYPYAALIQIWRRCPIILSLFGLLDKVVRYRGVPRSFYNILNLISEKKIIKFLSNIVVESNFNRRILMEYTRKSNIHVIQSGIEIKSIENAEERVRKHLEEIRKFKFDLLYVGRLSREKGVDILLKSMYLLNREYNTNVRLCVVGSGPQKNEIINMIQKLDLSGSVVLVGYIPEEVKYIYYFLCKLVVVPSRWDFAPTTVLEAMACKKPVIVSDATNSDLIVHNKNGYIFKSENYNDLAEKIYYLLYDKNRISRFGSTSYKIAKMFDWRFVAERYIKLYSSLLDP